MATKVEERATVADRATADRTAHLALWGVVVAAAAVLVFENRHMWFGGDEWFVITDRGVTDGPGRQGVLQPFNEHWTALPILAFRGIYALVGVHSYWPYVALVIIAHLAAVVLLWHVMVRSRIDAWVALGACATFAVLGIGSENLLTAWQVTLVAAFTLGLGAIVVAPDTGRFTARDAVASGLLTAAVMCSGVALPMLVVVGIIARVRRGWTVAAQTLAVPVLVYALWYAVFGGDAESIADPAPAKVPAFVWHGLTDALGDVARLDVVGVVVVVAVAAWLTWKLSRRPVDRNLLVPVALAIGGVLFLATTGWRRANLPGSDPALSRYAYVTVAFVLPLVAMAAHRLFCCDTPRRALLGVVTVALVVGQVRVLDHAAELAEPGKRSDRGAMLATAALARDGRRFIYQSPLHPFEPQVTVDEIVAMDRDGKLPPRSDATVRDRLTVLARLDLALQRDAVVAAAPGSTVALGPLRHATATPAPSGPSGPGCVQITARSGNEVTLRPSGPAAVGLSGDGLVRMWLRDEDRGTDGEAVVGVLTPGAPQVLSIGGIEGSVVLSLPEGPGTVVCGVG